MKILIFTIFILSTFSNLNGQIYSENLILYLNFENEFLDQSPSELIVDNFGGVFDLNRFGDENASVLYDGVNDFSNIINEDAFCIENEISFSLWLKLNEIPIESDPILLISNKTNFVFEESRTVGLRISQSSIAMSYYNLTGGSLSRDTANIAHDLEWHHLVGIFNKNTNKMKLYIDGNLTDENIIQTDLSVDDLRYVFISGGYMNEYLSSNIDDLRIYNREISECEILSLYNEFVMEIECTPPNKLNCNLVGTKNIISTNKLNIYPNPTGGRLYIKNINKPFRWYLYSSVGEIMKSGFSDSNNIDLSVFPDGIYFLKVDNNIVKVILN